MLGPWNLPIFGGTLQIRRGGIPTTGKIPSEFLEVAPDQHLPGGALIRLRVGLEVSPINVTIFVVESKSVLAPGRGQDGPELGRRL